MQSLYSKSLNKLPLCQQTQHLPQQHDSFQAPRFELSLRRGESSGGLDEALQFNNLTAAPREALAPCPKKKLAAPPQRLPLAIKILQKFPKRAVSIARNFSPNHLSPADPPPAPAPALSSSPNDTPLRQMPKATAGVLVLVLVAGLLPVAASVSASSRGTGTSRAGSSTLTCAFFTVTSRFRTTLWMLCTVCKLILAARLPSSATPPPSSSASLLRIALT